MHWKVSGVENVGSKLQMDSVFGLRTSGCGSLLSESSLEKTKAKKKTVQVIEFSIFFSQIFCGRERHYYEKHHYPVELSFFMCLRSNSTGLQKASCCPFHHCIL